MTEQRKFEGDIFKIFGILNFSKLWQNIQLFKFLKIADILESSEFLKFFNFDTVLSFSKISKILVFKMFEISRLRSFSLLRAVQSVQYFPKNVLINAQNLIYAISIDF